MNKQDYIQSIFDDINCVMKKHYDEQNPYQRNIFNAYNFYFNTLRYFIDKRDEIKFDQQYNVDNRLFSFWKPGDFEPLIFGYQRCQSITLNHGNRYTTIQWYDDFKVIAIHDEEGVVSYYNHNGHKGINIIDRIHYFGPTDPLSFLFYHAEDFIIDVHDVVKKVLIDLVKTLKYHISHHYHENKRQGTIDEFRYHKL
jgi:hypothetical protein